MPTLHIPEGEAGDEAIVRLIPHLHAIAEAKTAQQRDHDHDSDHD